MTSNTQAPVATPPRETPEQQIARLQAENAKLRAKAESPLKLKVAEKSGVVMVVGMRSFPIALYRSEWARLLSYGEEIREFIEEHSSQITAIETRRAAEELAAQADAKAK